MMVLSGLMIWSKRTALATAQAFKRTSRQDTAQMPAGNLRPIAHKTAERSL